MKLFIKKNLLFFLPLALLSYPLDLLISSRLKESNTSLGEYEVWSDIYRGSIDAEIAIYGSSRAWVHLNPQIFESKLKKPTYNLGIDGHSFHLQYLRHKEYFKFNKHPKMIILSLDVFTLSKRTELYNYSQFSPYMLWNKTIFDFTSSYKGFSRLDYFIPLIRYKGEKNFSEHLFESDTSSYRYKGFKGFDRKWNTNLEDAKKTKTSNYISVDSNTVKLFKKFIRDVQKEGVRLVFVYTPEYIEGQDFTENRGEVISFYSSLSKSYEVPFLNYSDSLLSYRKELFYNTLHLNEKGANIFTEKFIADLEVLKYLTESKIREK